MIGGFVKEVILEPETIWIDCIDPNHPKDTCAIRVKRTEQSEKIEPGDSLWWQGHRAMWTPCDFFKNLEYCEHREHENCLAKSGVDYDIQFERVGYSGVSRPASAV